MTTRVLPVEEWPRLEGTEADTVWPTLDPSSSQVLVVESDAGEIVASWIVMTVLHVECLWIHPDHRGSMSVGRLLLTGMWRLVRSLGGKAVMTCASSDDVRRLLEKVGATKVPADCYVMPIPEGK